VRGERQEGEGGEAAGEVLCATLRLLGQRSAAEAEMAAGWVCVVSRAVARWKRQEGGWGRLEREGEEERTKRRAGTQTSVSA
jgi:hypothetical protein